ncbi:MAG: serpin family protein [Anaerolineales bacterium]|nr:serpin family protein [Anaerolineales bacterium]
MKTPNLNRIISQSLFASFLILILAGCSEQIPISPGGSNPQVLASKLPRAEVDDVPVENIYTLAAGNTAFSLDLYQQLQVTSGNLFFSPFSISSALAMTYAGAEGDTADEMSTALHFLLEQEKLHPAFNALDQHLAALAKGKIQEDQGDPFQLNIANAIWGQKDYRFEENFLDTLAGNYGAGLRLLDFILRPEESRQEINHWVSDQTQEKIQNLIPQGAINSDTRLVLSNAIYFKAGWLEPFEEIFTDAGLFTGVNGEKTPVTMMQHGSDPNFLYCQGDEFQVVDLPYVGGQTSMLVLVPDHGLFEEFEKELSGEILDQVMKCLSYSPVALTFPKFEFESEISLAQTLAMMGMPNAFSDMADFSGMTGMKDLFISDVFHKAFVSVDEEGTEAAAATAVLMSTTSMPENPVELTVDRPFMFLIREHETNSILFMGRVVEP